MSPNFDLTGKTALVTGSTRGIGRAIAEALGAAGAALYAHGSDAAAIEERVQDWTIRGFRAAGVKADLSKPEDIGALPGHMRLGSPDILVLNASVEIDEGWDELTPDAMHIQGMVNVNASALLIQSLLPHMLAKGWGRVLAIGSVQEERPNARHIFYAATKVAQTSLILNLARHTRAHDVTFNVLTPGAIETDRNRARLSDPNFRTRVEERIPLGTIGRPEDCAGAALLLCSDAGRYINGAVLAVDGGLRL